MALTNKNKKLLNRMNESSRQAKLGDIIDNLHTDVATIKTAGGGTKIKKIKLNGVELQPDENGVVSISTTDD